MALTRTRIRTWVGKHPVWAVTLGTVFGILVWEHHKSGEWHAHALIAGTEGRGRFLSGLHAFCKKDPILGHLWMERPESESAAKYIAKYVAKGPGRWEPIGERWFDDPDATPELVRALQSESENTRA